MAVFPFSFSSQTKISEWERERGDGGVETKLWPSVGPAPVGA
jgi:hypothetical protein